MSSQFLTSCSFSFMVADIPQMRPEQKWHSINAKKNEVQAARAFGIFRGNGIEPILIKGLAAAIKYPAHDPRIYADIDLSVSENSYRSALQLVHTNPDVKDLNIDIHKGLRHLDTLPFETLFNNSQLVEINGNNIRVLSEEDHLRVMAVHWLNDGGEYRERLYDIFYAVSNRYELFDWERCLECVSDKRRKWIIYAIGLAHKYLNLYIDDLPFADEAKHLPKWLTVRVEKEWKSNIRLIPLSAVKNDRKKLVEQLLKRIFPNPIQATIEMEGNLDGFLRHIYPTISLLKRSSKMISGLFLREKNEF